MEFRSGAYRHVVLAGGFAIKFPRVQVLSDALRCSRWEREMWRTWRPVFGWTSLCPVLFADPVGFILVMPRAARVTDDQITIAEGDRCEHPGTTSEPSTVNSGLVGGELVDFDYGVPSAREVQLQRADYVAHRERLRRDGVADG